MFLSFFSLENTLQVALGKCLGTAGTLRLPLVMPYRCIAPGEKESVNFTLKYNSSKGPQGKPCVLDDWIVFASSSCGNSQLALFRVFFHNSPSFTLTLIKQTQDKVLSLRSLKLRTLHVISNTLNWPFCCTKNWKFTPVTQMRFWLVFGEPVYVYFQLFRHQSGFVLCQSCF